MNTPEIEVSAVISTQGRRSLESSVESAMNQSGVRSEVIVAVDGTASLVSDVKSRLPAAVKVVSVGEASNANVARNAGIALASGEYVALLDDDDIWDTHKLRRQLDEVQKRAPADGRWLCATDLRTFGAIQDITLPCVHIREDEQITEYLFFREKLRPRPNYIQLSTWLAPKAVFTENQFHEGLALHQDFDWLIRAVSSGGIQVLQIGEVLSRYRVNTGESISAESKAKASLRWLNESREYFTRRSAAEFVLLVPHAFALRENDILFAIRLIGRSMSEGRPGIRALVVAGGRTVRIAWRRGLGSLSLWSNSRGCAKSD